MKTSISFSSLSPNKRRSPSTPSLTSLRRSQSIVAELEELMSDENVPNADDVSLTQLNHYAVTLAGLHRITSKKDKPALIKRLDENVKVLNQAYDIINDAIMSGRRITSSDEWLVDNFWMITEQIHMAKKHLPARYSEEMPRLENTAVAGLPRIYGLVLELINLVNGQITEENIFQFVKSYQSKKQLALGELWGIPIMLRLGLLENIRHVADDIIARREDCNAADAWADKLLQAADTSSKSVVEVLFQMSQSDPKITNSFVVQITQRLQGSNPLLSVINTWIEQQVSNKGLDVDQICRSQRHTNYVNQISIRNSITSLRFVNTHSWKDFVEQLSVTESILKQDPSGIYTLQDFDTRDACRHQVERLAHANKIPEQEIAQAVLKMCNRVQSETINNNTSSTAVNKNFNYKTDQRQTHVGYWLLNPEGLRKLRENMHYKIYWREKLSKKIGVDTLSTFLGSIALFTLLFVFIVLGLISEYDENFSLTGKWTLMLITCLTLVGSQLAVSLTNYIVVHLQGPRLMPRMNFQKGIPDEDRTMVVVPTMLTSPNGVKELIDDLQARYLVNRDKNICFGLITDFLDSKTETSPNDQELVDQVSKGVENLNLMYPNVEGYSPTFYLFHRKRTLNKQEGVYMGWERKRGKIEQFNSLLRGGSKEPFSVIIGDLSILQTIKYVITLDTDTMLPSDAARKMIETAAHVLNRPIIDEKLGRVVSGYGLLQPRVSVGLTGAHKSIYAMINSFDSGLDPYTKEVSDVYQDLFDEGSFIGKGLYHVEVFEKVMTDLLPQNRILSHDLLEGCYIRSGLVSDVELIEEYPASYSTEISRRHRWVRGDWQIAQWIFPFVPLARGFARNTLHMLSRWKIFDNLRRSLVPFAMVFIIVFGWLHAPFKSALPIVTTLSVLSVWLIPNILGTIEELIMKQEDVSLELHLKNVRFSIMRRAIDTAVNVVFLPFDAYNNLDAIARSLVRIHITRTGLLEWTTSTAASQTFSKTANPLIVFTRTMWVEPALAISIILVLFKQFFTDAASSNGNVFYFLINAIFTWSFIGVWMASTAIAAWLSKPMTQEIVERETIADLPEKNVTFLKALSRKTFRFFETWVREEDNYLPIDNFQEFPKPMLARRTSPTNIGLALLSFIAANDFGYITIGDAVERVTQTLLTMSKMDRFKGHFYNWYDTADLKPLLPRYVSAVDSGNLVGLLIVLRTSLLEFIDRPLLSEKVFTGMSDNLLVLNELIAQRKKAEEEDEEDLEEFDYNAVQNLIQTLQRELSKPPTSGVELLPWFDRIGKPANDLYNIINKVVEIQRQKQKLEEVIVEDDVLEENITETTEMTMAYYANSIITAITNIREEVKKLAPWILMPLPVEFLTGSLASNTSVIEFRQKYNTLGFDLHLGQIAQVKNILQIEKLLKVVDNDQNATKFLIKLSDELSKSELNAQERMDHLNDLADMCDKFSDQDFSFMYNETRNLIAIGYNVEHKSLDKAYYDVFCSEARICSYVGIARGQFPVKHWFSMSRLLTQQYQKPALLSWSGSMFEYLMPLLIMPTVPGTLLDQTYTSVVLRQIEYGQQKKVPWGISESAYNMMDAGLVYQYGPFGVPGLGLKRGLSNDLVIAPYASVMSLMVLPREASENLMRQDKMGLSGNYGMIESADFTPHRLRGDISHQPIRSFFSHHEGMSFLALAYTLLDKPMQKRFSNTPELHANELLLQEKIPKIPYVSNPNAQEKERWAHNKYDLPSSNRRFVGLQCNAAPEVHLLSNGRLHVTISTHGGGQIRWKDLSVTRWREDVTLDGYGISCYLRDVDNKDIWSTTSTPIIAPADQNYKVMFSQAKAEFKRNQNGILSETIVTVSSHDDVEVRRINLSNNGTSARHLELTSYGELVLGQGRADAAHRTFSNLFIKTETLPERNAILACRQPRSHGERVVWAFHIMLLHEPKNATNTMSFETDRYKFIGRGYSMQKPKVLVGDFEPLGNTQGFPLDPIIAIRQQLRVQPGKTLHVDFVTGVAFSREEAIKIIDKYQNKRYTNRVINYSWISSEKLCFRLGITEIEAQLFAKLAGCLLYSSSRYRASAGLIAKNRGNQSGLWRFGIGGDLPIMLVRIGDVQNLGLIEQCLQAHVYLRYKGLVYDLVIWNDETASYRDELQHNLMQLVASSKETSESLSKSIFFIRGEQLTETESILLYSVARVVFSDNGGSLTDQIDRANNKDNTVPTLVPTGEPIEVDASIDKLPTLEERKLYLTNDLGGFDKKRKEYVIILNKNDPKCMATPQPWVNVIANEQFGTVVSEKGSAYTWFDNAHEFRLSPWNNDIVVDGSGETFYIRDEVTGKFWSPMPQPVTSDNPYTIRHGMGYSIWQHSNNGIKSKALVFVPQNEPVKVVFIKLTNNSGRRRTLSVSGFVEWTLGELRDRSQSNIVTDIEIGSNSTAVLARNAFNMDFTNHVAFFSVVGHECTVTADRSEFIGYNRTLSDPAAMYRTHLSGTVGAALDPCAGIHVPVSIDAGKTVEVAFIMGAHRSKEQAKDLIERIRSNLIVRQLLKSVKAFWTHTLSSIQVETPDAAVDVLANGWLLYQVLSSRIWGRSGFYQSSGAFGFRDQLQDTLSVINSMPQIIHDQIITCCEHQFEKGDVCHWWHPQSNRGVRTSFSDDYLWLPLALSQYVTTTNDESLLGVNVRFLTGPELQPGEESHYDQLKLSDVSATVYEHAKRAVKYGLKYGVHGLPLMGCGDWNDGMNLVGIEGKGESVWLAFFLYHVLEKFEKCAEVMEDFEFITVMREHREQVRVQIEKEAWDGGWYRRAFFDNGEPLGSSQNDECQIDSLPQSWGVISGAADQTRVLEGLQAAYNRLVRKDLKLIQLFDPAFEKSHLNPGYIKGYAPGVRENGGQYTHAAIWMVWAYTLLRENRRAWELFDILNPVNHTQTRKDLETYRVEPYVVAADVYTLKGHEGHGGWTWYTGSAGWMYRLIIEQLLGIKKNGDYLFLAPCPRPDWNGYKVHYRHGKSVYHISFVRAAEATKSSSMLITVDGVEAHYSDKIHLIDDNTDHNVQVHLL